MAQPSKSKIAVKRRIKQQKTLDVSKDKLLIKNIVVVVIKAILVIAALSGILYFLQSQHKAKLQIINPLQAQLSTDQARASSLAQQLNSLGEAAKVYTSLMHTRSNMKFDIDPFAIRPLLAALKAKYHLSTLNIEVSTKENLLIEGVNEESPEAIRYEVKMNIGSISDHFIYQFFQDLLLQFPGFVQVQAMGITRLQPISIVVLTKVRRGLKVETAASELIFYWYGYGPRKQAANQSTEANLNEVAP